MSSVRKAEQIDQGTQTEAILKRDSTASMSSGEKLITIWKSFISYTFISHQTTAKRFSKKLCHGVVRLHEFPN